MNYVKCQINRGPQTDLIGYHIELACGFFPRLKGLLGRSGLAEGEGMLLSPCSSIHCYGMKFPIDVIFLDRDYRVVDLKGNMKPGSHAACRAARFVLELKAGEIKKHNIEIGQRLEFS